MSGLCSEMDVDWHVEVILAEMETSLSQPDTKDIQQIL